MKHVFLTAVALVLGGCQTMGPQARGPSAAEIMAADPTNSCMKRVNEDPFILTHLAAKTGVGRPGSPSIEMLSDKTVPNEQERQALSTYSGERQRCIDLGGSYRRQNMPAQVTQVMEQGAQNVTFLLAKLYAGEITFGEYNTRRIQNGNESRARLTDFDQRRQQQQQADEDRRRSDVANALQNMNNQMLLQQQINDANRPRTTNCQRIGAQVNCTTY
jgi:hypothetical protein